MTYHQVQALCAALNSFHDGECYEPSPSDSARYELWNERPTSELGVPPSDASGVWYLHVGTNEYHTPAAILSAFPEVFGGAE